MTAADTPPDPLVPADVDLRDFGFMPLHVQRLRDSELVDLSTGDEFKAAVLLWAYAWHQQPAASIPDDDRILAARSGAGANWRKVKAMALRGFIRCSDGRLYHPLIAEAAADAWRRRGEFQENREHREDRKERYRARLRELSAALRGLGATVPKDRSLEVLERALEDAKAAHDANLRGRSGDSPGDASVDASGDARDVKRGRPGDALDRDSGQGQEIHSEPGGSGAKAPPAAEVATAAGRHEPPPTDRDMVFATGVAMLTAAGVSDKNARSFLAAQCKAHGEAAVLNAIDRCAVERPIQPVPWLQAALGPATSSAGKPRRADAIMAANIAAAQRFLEGQNNGR